MSGTYLTAHHQRELAASAIDPAVMAERHYQSLERPTVSGNQNPLPLLKSWGFPSWATKENTNYPGLLIPVYRATGERISCQWKPRKPPRNRDGKEIKYVSPKGGASRLDVHPRNTSRIADPTVPLWITEGIKKADALTSAGCCVVALQGVFNWRSIYGTLGDWEDVPLRGREVVVCFDADAITNPNVARAMQRLGNWLAGEQPERTGASARQRHSLRRRGARACRSTAGV
jgi:hypothetical protein